jgi:4a-hydroxytetrahydrobiopterin dehydratase
MPKKLTKKNLNTALRTLSAEWELDDNATHLIRTISCRSYLLGFMLVTKIAIHAEVQRQYPTVTLTEKQVRVTLTTNIMNGISDQDIKLAKQIDELLLSTKR